jgi:hypothetical protein
LCLRYMGASFLIQDPADPCCPYAVYIVLTPDMKW